MHKRMNPTPYRKDEALACWRQITAPVMFVESDETQLSQWWGTRYSHEEFEERLKVVPRLQQHKLTQCGHMLHHDQPQALAELLERFLQ